MKAEAVREDGWQLTRASVRGKAHFDNGLPNQDCVAARASDDGRIVAAVVSDGAGTAPQADTGSRTTCELMVACLLEIGGELMRARMDREMVLRKVAAGIGEVRRRLDPTGKSLRDYHCTFVGCVLTERGGYVCQVGDSIAVSTCFTEGGELPPEAVDFFPDSHTRVFVVDRGEYANETHFITEEDWRSHLRISPLANSQFDALLLMTDGAMNVAMVQGKVFRGFLSNLIGKLLATPDEGERDGLLKAWLMDRRTYKATGDDKTMFVAIRNANRDLAGRPIHLGDSTGHAAKSKAARQPSGESEPAPVPAPIPVPAGIPTPAPAAGVGGTDAPASRASSHVRAFVASMGAVTLLSLLALLIAVNPPTVRDAIAWTRTSIWPPPAPETGPGITSAKGNPAVLPAAVTKPAHQPKEQEEDVAQPPEEPMLTLQSPVAAQETPGLAFMHQPELELVMRPGASTRVTVRVVGGREPHVAWVEAQPPLRVDTGTPCVADGKRNGVTCVLNITAPKRVAPGRYSIWIAYSDPRDEEEHALTLPVRLVAAPSK